MSVLDYFKKEEKPESKPGNVPEKKVEAKAETEKTVQKPKTVVKPVVKTSPESSLAKNERAALILTAPHISEKSSLLSTQNQYVFRVIPRANKPEIKKAIEALYRVKVTSVNIINRPPRPKKWQRQPGYQSGYKKAIITLKAGDQIEIIP